MVVGTLPLVQGGVSPFGRVLEVWRAVRHPRITRFLMEDALAQVIRSGGHRCAEDACRHCCNNGFYATEVTRRALGEWD